MGRFGTGQSTQRVEDERLITGHGRYLDDIQVPGCLRIAFLRSPYAHGRITELDIADARSLPGVRAVYTIEDLDAAGIRDVPASPIAPSSLSEGRPPVCQPALARGYVRYVGEPVAAVVADSAEAAQQAVEAILFDVDELPAAATLAAALADGAPQLHDDVAGNVLGTLEHGNREQTDTAFAAAAHVVDIDIVNNRLAPTAMETRGCIASFDGDSGEYTLHQGCQGVHVLRERIAACLPVSEDKLHVVSPDVGGGFGLKMFLQCETISALHAARDVGAPVKWVADRSESFLSDLHGRDHRSHAELAMDAEGRFTAIRVHVDSNVGAYTSQAGGFIAWFGACMTTGAYAIPAAYASVRLVMTNTVPVDAYRGAGRPEAIYLIERLVDKAARHLGITPDDIRRRNLIPADAFPYRTPTGQVYDSGEYLRVMETCLERADWSGFEARRRAAAGEGLRRGIGLAYYVEICSSYGDEDTHVRFERDGTVTVLMGTQSTGQGHETSFGQMVAAGLGIPLDGIRVLQGDTRVIPTGQGTGGSRSMAIGGGALVKTIDTVIDKGRRMAADLFETDAEDVEFESGVFRVAGTDRRLPIREVAAASFDEQHRPDGVDAGLASNETFQPEAGTFPNGCHVCEVEIEPDTGALSIVRYTIQDDVGVVVNPLLLEGQIMGGVAQGLGQAMMEEAVYDPESGQMQTASFLDYTMPRADNMPDIDFAYTEVPSPRNPLGVKGAGEAGTIGSPPALVNAVVDALYGDGVTHLDMPVTAHRIWRAIRDASQTAA